MSSLRRVAPLLVFGLVFACKRGEEEEARPEKSPGLQSDDHGNLVPTDEPEWTEAGRGWVALMRKQFPAKGCEDASYLRQCFSLDRAGCESRLGREFEICLHKLSGNVPKEVNADTGREAGRILGMCAGSAYEIGLKTEGKHLGTPKCNDPAQWMK